MPNFFGVQRQTIDFCIRAGYALVANEMGTGKTLCALATAVETDSRLLILCPSFLKFNWQKEVRKFYPELSVYVVEKKTDIVKLWDTDVVILSYSFVHLAEIYFEWADMVVGDESHYLKSTTSIRTKFTHKFIFENSIKRVLLLTGTPIENRVHELYSPLAICTYNPKAMETGFTDRFPSYVDFANYFSNISEFEMKVKAKKGGMKKVKVQTWSGVKNVQELKSIMAPYYIRKTLDEVVELDQGVVIDVYADYKDDPKLEAAFDQFQEDGALKGVSSDIKAKAALATAAFTAEYAKNLLEQGLKVIVFSDHPAAAEFIAQKLDCESIDGTTSMKKREDMTDAFQEGRTDRIVATIGSMATGKNLYAGQDIVVNDLPWKPSVEDQMKGRTRRIGQKGKPRYHYIRGTIQSVKISEKLEAKREVIRSVL